MNSLKLHLDEILVALWNDVQNRTGRGLDTMCEGGIAIDRQVIKYHYQLFIYSNYYFITILLLF